MEAFSWLSLFGDRGPATLQFKQKATIIACKPLQLTYSGRGKQNATLRNPFTLNPSHRHTQTSARTITNVESNCSQPGKSSQSSDFLAQKQINADFCESGTAQDVLNLLDKHADVDLSDVNLVTAFHRLAKHAGSRGSKEGGRVLGSSQLPALVLRLEQSTQQWTSMGVANLLWAHSVLGHGSKALLEKAYRRLDTMSIEESTHCCMTLVLAMSKLRRPSSGYIRRLNAALDQQARQASKQQQQPAGTSRRSAAPASAAFLGPGTDVLARLSTQKLSLFIHSLASLGEVARPALQASLSELAARDLGDLTTRSLCQVSRALVLGEVYHAPASDAVAAAVAALPDSQLDGQSCSRLLHDYGLVYQRVLVRQGLDPHHRLKWQRAVRSAMGRVPARRAMLGRLAQRAREEVGAMDRVSLTSLVWGLATLGQREGGLLDAIAQRAQRLGTQLDAQGVACLCWAFAALSHDHPPLMEAMAEATLSLLRSPGRRDEFSAQAVPMVVLGFAVLNRCESRAARDMLEALAGRAEEILPQLSPQGLSNLGWGLAVAGVFPPPLFRAWQQATAQRLPQYSHLELNQLHQTQLALRLEAPHLLSSDAGSEPYPALLDALYQAGRVRSTAKRGWERGQRWGVHTVTRWQQQVFDLLCSMGVECEIEYLGAGGEYSVDIAIPSHTIAVECDGPSHFMANSRHVEGGTALKHRLLRLLGWRVLVVPYFDWPGGRKGQAQYLQRLLEGAGLELGHPPDSSLARSVAGSVAPPQQGEQQPKPPPQQGQNQPPQLQQDPSDLPPRGTDGCGQHAQQLLGAATSAPGPGQLPEAGAAPVEALHLRQGGGRSAAAAREEGEVVPGWDRVGGGGRSSRRREGRVPERDGAGGGMAAGDGCMAGRGQGGAGMSLVEGISGEWAEGNGVGGGGAEGAGDRGTEKCDTQGRSEGSAGDETEVGGGPQGATAQRAKRLALLRYRSGDLSRTELLKRHGKAPAPRAPQQAEELVDEGDA